MRKHGLGHTGGRCKHAQAIVLDAGGGASVIAPTVVNLTDGNNTSDVALLAGNYLILGAGVSITSPDPTIDGVSATVLEENQGTAFNAIAATHTVATDDTYTIKFNGNGFERVLAFYKLPDGASVSTQQTLPINSGAHVLGITQNVNETEACIPDGQAASQVDYNADIRTGEWVYAAQWLNVSTPIIEDATFAGDLGSTVGGVWATIS